MAERTIDVSMVNLASLFGEFDCHMKQIEKELAVSVSCRDSVLKILGGEEETEVATRVIHSMIESLARGDNLSEQGITYTIMMSKAGQENALKDLGQDCVCMTARGKPIKSKTLGQKEYIQAMNHNTVVFGIGPAGTGKTYLAVAKAVTAFRKKEVSRIIITRPAVEAGEKLGFLPGDLQNKVDPYLRPLHDALFEMIGTESYNSYVEKGLIEVAPLAYMRGRTLDNSYIILDEAQNTTPEQMKMFLTRIGFGSKAVITGDITQIDLPDGKRSGLKEAIKILSDVEDLAFCYFSHKDVVRHPLVQKIIQAYEKYDAKRQKNDRSHEHDKPYSK
ncbi:MAG: PhoH family protein [Ruminococcaceae bacterium]|nr:PhoH family protein [Oscillospiraceae bacterium]